MPSHEYGKDKMETNIKIKLNPHIHNNIPITKIKAQNDLASFTNPFFFFLLLPGSLCVPFLSSSTKIF